MTAGRTYWVSSPDAGEPWRVVVDEEGDGWVVRVERDGESSSFPLSRGPDEGRAWVGDRPLRFRWEPGEGGPGRLELGGRVHTLRVRTEAEHRLATVDLGAGPAALAREVRAPMPGLVVKIEVEEGAEVAEGEGIAIIEAMKMENEIAAPIAGVVRDLSVVAGDTVERGTLLCRVEPVAEGAP